VIQVHGIWLPSLRPGYKPTVAPLAITRDGRPWGGRYEQAATYCRQRRVAIDCGAHVGTFTRMMAAEFEHVHAFEPWSEHLDCFERNLAHTRNVTLHPAAVGEFAGVVMLGSASDLPVRIVEQGVRVDQVRLDDLGLENVDFLKTNLEGYDLAALHGAEELLKRWHPVLLIEQHHVWKPSDYGYGDLEALDYLRNLGAQLRFRWQNPRKKRPSPHYCLSWDD
jgi:FkbM family methyltransferase